MTMLEFIVPFTDKAAAEKFDRYHGTNGELVRCRDCKYGKLCLDADGHRLIQCTNTKYPAANVETWPLELDWYCAGGERRESE
jgi:hypothetical protein